MNEVEPPGGHEGRRDAIVAVAAIAGLGVVLIAIRNEIGLSLFLTIEIVLVIAILLLVIGGVFRRQIEKWRRQRQSNSNWRRIIKDSFGEFQVVVNHLGRFVRDDRIRSGNSLSKIYEKISLKPQFTPLQAFPPETMFSRQHYLLQTEIDTYDENISIKVFMRLCYRLSELISSYSGLVKNMVDMLQWLGPKRLVELQKTLQEPAENEGESANRGTSELGVWVYEIDEETKIRYQTFRQNLKNFLSEYDRLVTRLNTKNFGLMNYPGDPPQEI